MANTQTTFQVILMNNEGEEIRRLGTIKARHEGEAERSLLENMRRYAQRVNENKGEFVTLKEGK